MSGVSGEVSPHTAHVVDEAMPALLQAVEKDDDKEAVSVAVTAAAEIVRGCGPTACAKHLDGLIKAVTKVCPSIRIIVYNSRPHQSRQQRLPIHRDYW